MFQVLLSSLSIYATWRNFWLLLGALCTLIPGLWFTQKFVAPGLDLYLVLLALPFVLMVEQRGKRSLRYGWMSLGMMLLYVVLHVQTIYFLAFCLFLCFLVEITLGAIGRIPILMAALISPVVHYVISVFSFPIRLQLSKMVAFCLNLFQGDVVAQGNVILMGSESYTVERACIGLKMVITSFILGLTILAYHQQKKKIAASRKQFAFFAAILLVLVVLTNFFRILVLVKFRIPPEHLAHDAVGMLALAFYVLLPLWFIAPKLIKGRPFHSKVKSLFPFNKAILIPLLFAIATAGAFAQYHYRQTREVFKEVVYPTYTLEGFTEEQPFDDVRKLSTNKQVVYLKPCKSFYHSTHTPTVCWRGSGFDLYAERQTQFQGQPLFMAELRKDTNTLYTAWWYENPNSKTIDQWKWREDMLKGEPTYSLVNATATSKEGLENLLEEMLMEP